MICDNTCRTSCLGWQWLDVTWFKFVRLQSAATLPGEDEVLALLIFCWKKVSFCFDFDYFLDVRTPCLFGNVRAALTLMPKSIRVIRDQWSRMIQWSNMEGKPAACFSCKQSVCNLYSGFQNLTLSSSHVATFQVSRDILHHWKRQATDDIMFFWARWSYIIYFHELSVEISLKLYLHDFVPWQGPYTGSM